MGTDIHLYIERRDPATGLWSVVAPPEPPPAAERTEKRKDRDGKEYDYVSPFWGPHQCMYISDDDDDEEDEHDRVGRLRWYSNRNYDVFAILTGTVRNGVGFAGCGLGDGFHGIVSEPRGLPDDVGLWSEFASWDHSEGWLYLDEILEFNWDQVTRKRGVIQLSGRDRYDPDNSMNYLEWRALPEPRPAPKSYCGMVSGPGVRVVKMSDAERSFRSTSASSPWPSRSPNGPIPEETPRWSPLPHSPCGTSRCLRISMSRFSGTRPTARLPRTFWTSSTKWWFRWGTPG